MAFKKPEVVVAYIDESETIPDTYVDRRYLKKVGHRQLGGGIIYCPYIPLLKMRKW